MIKIVYGKNIGQLLYELDSDTKKLAWKLEKNRKNKKQNIIQS